MRRKRYFLPLCFIVITLFLLQACNLAVSSPGGLSPAILSQTPGIPSDTPQPLASPTETLTFTPTASPMPTLTLTLFFAPTATTTRQWSACPGIVINQTDTDAGDMLHILRCEDGFEYDLGPIAKGTYAVGPNDKFLIYVTFSGDVYGARIGDTHMLTLFDLKREHIFTVFNMGTEPDMLITFSDGALNYKLVLIERSYDQKRMYELPIHLTN
jgi:hypothetical protein